MIFALFLTKNNRFQKNIVTLSPNIKTMMDMGISIDNVWAKAQRLSPSDRLALSRRLAESVNESEPVRRERVAKEIDRFFGDWSHDERATEDIMA